MALTPSTRLSLLTFPQSWDGQTLVVRFLCLPRRSPLDLLGPGLPSFRDASLAFKACLIASLDDTPRSANATSPVDALLLTHPPVDKAVLFDALQTELRIVDAPRPAVRTRQFRKATTASYARALGHDPHSPYLEQADAYACALHEASGDQQQEKTPATLNPNPRWGEAISYVLRQPVLAEALGLIGEAAVDVDASLLGDGGWLYIDLHDTSDGAGVPDLVARYAARLPGLSAGPLATVQAIFSPVLFPVDGDAITDDVYREAELYADGLAKIVHGAQLDGRAADPTVPERGDRIQLAWDDEQVATWLNRMVEKTAPNTDALKVDAPTGVAGFRVDVRETGAGAWHSLVRIASRGPLRLGDHVLRPFNGEGVIEVLPTQHATAAHGTYWLPPYFASWRGGSMALSDSQLAALHAQLAGAFTPAERVSLLGREQVFEPVEDDAVRLRYGHSYDFRVRLADLTRGGPDWQVADAAPPGTSIVSIAFMRRQRPGRLNRLFDVAEAEPTTVVLEKPRLAYPEALFAGASMADLKADLDTIQQSIGVDADGNRMTGLPREAGVFDPAVTTVRISVSVKLLSADLAPRGLLYETERDIPGDRLVLPLLFENHPTLDTFSAAQPSNGPLVLPTAREVTLTCIAVGFDTPGYFATADARLGTPIDIVVRRDAEAEGNLLLEPAAPRSSLHSFFFQPPEPGGVPPAARLAQELGMEIDGLTLRGRRGARTVIGSSAGLRHTLSPERSAITFGSASDLLTQWLSVARLTLARDWTWDGLSEAGITVTRVVRPKSGGLARRAIAGTIRMPHSIAPTARGDNPLDVRAAERQFTDVVFFDAFDPKPEPGQWPSELTVEYKLEPQFVAALSPAPTQLAIDLPITTPPVQVPAIVSAGFAFSPYERAGDYSSTDARERMLWFEFEEEPRDPRDLYFVRILGSGPDPALTELSTGDTPRPPDTSEPALAIEPEWMRHILPNQPRDTSGRAAMVPLEASRRSPRHYLIPLPEGLGPASPELFGFFTYEVRLGHASGWTTAQGRFGPALRVAGVQHPAPALTCETGRDNLRVVVRAPYAAAVRNGANVRARAPQTTLWAHLYARVRQVDGATWRNILIAQAPLQPRREHVAAADDRFGLGEFDLLTARRSLARLGLPDDAPLTVLVAETFNQTLVPRLELVLPPWHPLGDHLGHGRILRTSPLVAVPDAC